jgi:hypothetical protein
MGALSGVLDGVGVCNTGGISAIQHWEALALEVMLVLG